MNLLKFELLINNEFKSEYNKIFLFIIKDNLNILNNFNKNLEKQTSKIILNVKNTKTSF